ncbi:Trypsin, partial [Oryctes borbonicus]
VKMFHFVLVATLVACASASTLRRRVPQLDGRIVGGNSVDISDYPYQIFLQRYGSHICGGSVISEDFVVTAAHCTYGSSATTLSVRADFSVRGSGGSVVQVTAINQHPSFDYWNHDNDISVLRLASALNLSEAIAPIGLPSENQEFEAGTTAVVSGWGTTSQGGSSSLQLQAVEVPLVSNSECQSAYGTYEITDQMLCAGIEGGGKDACQDDSGGPLVVDGVLVGIVSWGIGCAEPEYLGVYSSVPALRSYISEVSGI